MKIVTCLRQSHPNAKPLGFAVHLASLRCPGRVLGPKEIPHTLALIPEQLRIDSNDFADCASFLVLVVAITHAQASAGPPPFTNSSPLFHPAAAT
jgi:hypothetical protein